MNNQQPSYILPWQAYGLNGFNTGALGVTSLSSAPIQAAGQLGKLATLPIAQQAAYAQQHQNLVSMGSALAGIPGLAQISFAGNAAGGLQLAGAGVYPIMSPSALSPYGIQNPQAAAAAPGMGINPATVLNSNGFSATQIPKLFVPSVKVGAINHSQNMKKPSSSFRCACGEIQRRYSFLCVLSVCTSHP